ncbi:carbon-nitrogen hydrolase family protein [Vibrio palustris]|uniref:2-oxoglutaramate amidase n=1 Tax=Vibrio palustris TaxID=1918946 RepID=A0A1R4B7K7_9VIBR|nr:carbon-nitrogen hydrolase family protein [Vibrio palustris]SJL84908.1 2-oxoglutaramate amidase [Vibrio palustris]
MSQVGIVQMTSGPSVMDNLKALEQQVAALANQGAQWIVTPENVILLSDSKAYHQYAEELGEGPIQQQLSTIAQRYGVWLLIGSFPIQREQGVTTTSILLDSEGQYQATYDKLHMFDVDVADSHHSYRESDTFLPGEQVVVAKTPFGSLGLSICYDLRFPQLFSELRRQGAEIIVVPAAFTAVTGKAHWEVLLRARAIETQCWIIAAGQTGTHPCGRQTWGHSMVVSPWGEIVSSLEQHTGGLVVEIDPSVLSDIRQAMPIIEQSRFCNQLQSIKSEI